MKVIVVGAGVGGLTTALALRAHGIETEILEAAPAGRTTGGGIGVASNATAVLRALGVDLPTAGVGSVCTAFELRTADGRPLRSVPIASIGAELGAPTVNIRRADLTALLTAAVPDTPIRYGSEVTFYTERADAVRVTCADGNTYDGDVLIGADGLRSAARRQLHGDEKINDYGYDCWYASVPFADQRLPAGAALHYWGRGQRFGLIDIGGGNAYWWATRNGADRGGPEKKALLGWFAGWAPEILDIVAGTPEEVIHRAPAQDRTFTETWGRGRVTLLGDAAHPMLTSLSQGGGSAIEDAYVLAERLAAAGGDPAGALRGYEDARRDRTRELVAGSRKLSGMEQQENPVVSVVRDLAFRIVPGPMFRNTFLAPMRSGLTLPA